MSRTDTSPRTAPSEITANPGRWTEVGELLASLYRIVDRLELLFPDCKFTPDGHLVGSIGAVIAARMFGLKLLPASTPVHDAITGDGRRVQIKFTQGTRGVALRAEPDHLLVLCLDRNRSPEVVDPEVVYNGKGKSPWSRSGKMQKNGQCQISLTQLRDIDRAVPQQDRLLLRATIDLALRDRE